VSPAGPVALGVVVVNFRSAQLLERNLVPLGREVPSAIVVVVDNPSTSTERSAVAELAVRHGWSLVTPERNGGFGAGVNEGVRRARELGCAAIVLVNPDAVVGATALLALHEQVAADPSAVVAPRIVDGAGRPYFSGAWLDMKTGRTVGRAAAAGRGDEYEPWLTAACLAMSSDVFDRSAGFAEEYFMYWEDVDFSFRARAAGARLLVRDDITVIHDEGGTQRPAGGRAKSPLYYRYNCRNRLLFGARHLDRRRLLGWILRTPVESWQILLRGGRRQLLTAPTASLLPTLVGTASGLVIALRALARSPQRRGRRNSIARR